MWVILVDIAAAVVGLAVLGLLGWRLFGQVKSLGKTVSQAQEQIGGLTADLERLAPPRR